ncbi:hypothetical protein K469DRAFT_377665 [Zopfia rhizophila CBS 207.26]|uniref:Uncharacterized protein n=1 Tax=Zopfia rhizophila CBS 207.26 TaxID=1314779 RepID=A0A6A6D4F1_9PEZI|nr:hypothetical protein K469DRAFT_377665 [Zopfia rhizophila CBS 207.26]
MHGPWPGRRYQSVQGGGVYSRPWFSPPVAQSSRQPFSSHYHRIHYILTTLWPERVGHPPCLWWQLSTTYNFHCRHISYISMLKFLLVCIHTRLSSA